jgi:TatA/E family protein of Tat protein translocase
MLSIPHLIIIFVVALVVFGPEKLPELARNLGKAMAEFKRATGDLRSTFEGHLKDLEREADQRKIGANMASSPSAAPAPIPIAAPAEITVPTLPSHMAGMSGGALEAPSEASNEPALESVQPEQTGAIEMPRKFGPDSETVSDGGTRPA